MAERRTGQASQGRRRGHVFSVRITDEEHARLAALQGEGGGPRALGPWLVHRALSAVGVVPGPGNTRVLPARVGSTDPGPVVPRRGSTGGARGERVILDLCAGSGSWSAPYEAAGYDVRKVTLPEGDVRTFVVPETPVHGVLAAPPCTQFSLARNGHPDLPRDFVEGMACVNACLRIVLQVRPAWWALENPKGHLSKWLGRPRDVFQPCDFGDPWTKETALWGEFTVPARGPFVEPKGGGPFCAECDGERASSWCNDPAHRAITPAGFARAFFEANP